MKEKNYYLLGKRLKKEREGKKITQEKLAEMAGCSTAHISHIETGNTIPSLKVILNIINCLNISSDLLLCDYTEHADYVFQSEMNDILQNCTATEVKFIVETAKENLRIYRKFKNK